MARRLDDDERESARPPSLNATAGLDDAIKVRLGKRAKRNLEWFADEEGISVSHLVRNVLRGWIRQQRRKRGWDQG